MRPRIRSFAQPCPYTTLCSHVTVGPLIRQNDLRLNGRGIVLLSAVDTTIRQNSTRDPQRRPRVDGMRHPRDSTGNRADGC
jgi:hypothetical protein